MADEISTREGYERWAASYDAADNPLLAMSSLALAEVARRCTGARVLELGCGTGRNGPPLLDAGARAYVGVDASSQMLARARARLGSDGRARFVLGALESSGVAPSTFDVVLFCLVLEHLATLDAALAAAAAATRVGGTLELLELHPALHRDGTRAHLVVDGRERTLPSWAHDEAELASTLPPCGFELVEVRSLYATSDACDRSPKLRKHLGRPLLLAARARRR